MKKFYQNEYDKVMTFILMLLLMFFSGFARAQCNSVDVTNLIAQNVEPFTESHLNLGSFEVVQVQGQPHERVCTDCVRDIYITGEGVIEIDVDWTTITIYKDRLVIQDGIVLILNNDIDLECGAEIYTIGTAQVYNTLEEYQQTLSIENYVMQNPRLPYEVYSYIGQHLGSSIRDLPKGVYIVRFSNGVVRKGLLNGNI